MAGSGVSAGHEVRALYYWEDNGFNASPSDSTAKTWGSDVTFDSAEGSNEVRRVFRPGTRNAIDLITTIFEGSWSVNFGLTNPWWLRYFLGSPSQTDNADGTYTYDYTGDSPDSFQIVIGHEQSGKERVFGGCVATRLTVDVSVGGLANVSLEGAYADEQIKSPASLTSQPTKNYDPMTFAEGTIDIGGTTEAVVQNASMTLEANADMIREMGTRVAVDFNPKELAPSFNFGSLFDGDHDSLEELYGGSGSTSVQEDADDDQAKVELKFDNGKAAGSGQNKGTFTATGSLPSTYGENGIGDPTADLEETVNRVAQDMTASWTNEESSAP